MDEFIEKRQFIRVPLTFVTVEVYSTYKQILSSETCSVVDISESGMKFLCKKHYEIKQPLRLTFVLPNSTIPIRAGAVVIYQQLQNELYNTGTHFTNLSLAELTLLKAYIVALTKKN